ncbi:hypothetical protein AWB76_05349 [Caballeronia temeraria]|uniref:Rhamnan synthesis protein F n=1 Tax=Caballeronia temeraria TaxID=1777137 RepID=A0A158CCW9_9BURK|nr:hypothetical protein [Caballeronia temeraria]SAK79756.1 hypothetical protein AWB76_05349 [Caballeronia temeraria]
MNSLSARNTASDPAGAHRAKSLVIYHFFEKDKNYIYNLAHFLLFGYSEDCDHIIVIAGEHTIDLPTRHNLRYVFTENKHNDFGGYSAVINALGNDALAYDFVYFVNSSVRGPFMPPYAGRDWKSVFSMKLTGDVGLVGPTINILSQESPFTEAFRASIPGFREPFSHVQTMAYAMPKTTLSYLIESGFYSNNIDLTKEQVVLRYEILLSQLVLARGLNIAALLPEFNKIDYRNSHVDLDPGVHRSQGDPSCAYSYFGRSAHPFEVIFVKTNRGIFSEDYLDRLTYSALNQMSESPEWTDCGFMKEYIDRINTVSRSAEIVQMGPFQMNVEQIVQLTEACLQIHPESREVFETILNRYRSA